MYTVWEAAFALSPSSVLVCRKCIFSIQTVQFIDALFYFAYLACWKMPFYPLHLFRDFLCKQDTFVTQKKKRENNKKKDSFFHVTVACCLLSQANEEKVSKMQNLIVFFLFNCFLFWQAVSFLLRTSFCLYVNEEGKLFHSFAVSTYLFVLPQKEWFCYSSPSLIYNNF